MLGNLTPAAREALRGIGQKAAKAAGETGARRRVAKRAAGMIYPEDAPVRDAFTNLGDLEEQLDNLMGTLDEVTLPPVTKDALRKALDDARGAASMGRREAAEQALETEPRIPERMARVDEDLMPRGADIYDIDAAHKEAFGRGMKKVRSRDYDTGKVDAGSYRSATYVPRYDLAYRLGMFES